jgi:hypothetical protein
MIQSLNTKVDHTSKATSFHGLADYGNVMVGDKAFEFYNEKNVADFIQIPWEEVDHVAAEVLFGRWISRFVVFSKENGHFAFSTKDNKATLRAMRPYVGEENMVRSPSFFDVIKLGVRRLFLGGPRG